LAISPAGVGNLSSGCVAGVESGMVDGVWAAPAQTHSVTDTSNPNQRFIDYSLMRDTVGKLYECRMPIAKCRMKKGFFPSFGNRQSAFSIRVRATRRA
jgi:hypothetical protein